jgi:hypothetical protein
MNEAPAMPAITYSEADCRFALRLLEKGKSLPEVEGKLLGRGLSPDQTAALLTDLATQSLYAEAEYLLLEGQSPAAVAAALVVRGLEKGDADMVVADVQKFHNDQDKYFRYAIAEQTAGKSSEAIEAGLLGHGASPELAKFVQRQVGRLYRWEVRKVGLKNLGIGSVLLALGLGITVFSLVCALEAGGTWFVMGGLTISGAVMFFRGLGQVLTGSDDAQ